MNVGDSHIWNICIYLYLGIYIQDSIPKHYEVLSSIMAVAVQYELQSLVSVGLTIIGHNYS